MARDLLPYELGLLIFVNDFESDTWIVESNVHCICTIE